MKGLLYIRGSRRKVSQLTLAFQPYENQIIKEISKQSFSFTCKRNFNSGQTAQYGRARHKQTGDYKEIGENNNLFHLLQVMGAGGAGALVFLLIVLVAVTTR